jgi:FkbM family methyltransferase
MKNIKKFLPEKLYTNLLQLYNIYITDYATKTYSQEGEDLILQKIFFGKDKGFYIDVGAHHPKRFSNTYSFYKKGWRGINIEARPGSKTLFDKYRPRDINLEKAISSERMRLKYFMYNDPALNSFSTPNLSNLVQSKRYKVIKEINIETERLDEVLKLVISNNQVIDFMSIDVEGLDYDVLMSNNWQIFKPNIVLIEDAEYDFKHGSKIAEFLELNNYKIFAKTYNTCFYKLL